MDNNQNMPKGASGNNAAQTGTTKEKNTGMAIVAYLLFFVPLLTDAKNDPFVKFHVKQGLTLFIAGLIVSFVSLIPPFYWISWIGNIAIIVLLVVGIMNAANGRQDKLPVIGSFSEHFTF